MTRPAYDMVIKPCTQKPLNPFPADCLPRGQVSWFDGFGSVVISKRRAKPHPHPYKCNAMSWTMPTWALRGSVHILPCKRDIVVKTHKLKHLQTSAICKPSQHAADEAYLTSFLPFSPVRGWCYFERRRSPKRLVHLYQVNALQAKLSQLGQTCDCCDQRVLWKKYMSYSQAIAAPMPPVAQKLAFKNMAQD